MKHLHDPYAGKGYERASAPKMNLKMSSEKGKLDNGIAMGKKDGASKEDGKMMGNSIHLAGITKCAPEYHGKSRY